MQQKNKKQNAKLRNNAIFGNSIQFNANIVTDTKNYL